MKKYLFILGIIIMSISCEKDDDNLINNLWDNRIDELYSHNEKKVTIVYGLSGTLTMLPATLRNTLQIINRRQKTENGTGTKDDKL